MSPSNSSASSPQELQKASSTTRRSRAGIAQALAFPKPALGHAIEPISVDRPRLGGKFRQRPMTILSEIHEQYEFVRDRLGGLVNGPGKLGNLITVLVDDPLIDLDRLGPLAVPGQARRIAEQGLGLLAGVGVELRRPVVQYLSTCIGLPPERDMRPTPMSDKSMSTWSISLPGAMVDGAGAGGHSVPA